MFKYTKRFAFGPQPHCPWSDKMVLNPAIIRDPEDTGTLHMLFRATGPWPEGCLPGKPLPYPIFLGYAVSRDSGKSWNPDFSHPAMAPALQYDRKNIFTTDIFGRSRINYANGCIEDPRLFYFENNLYLSVACRIFPPGPYWEHDDPAQCMPDWALCEKHGLGRALTENSTVSLLYKVDLSALRSRQYGRAFTLVGPLHDPDISDDRDVVLFPRRLRFGDKEMIVCIHRPKHPWNYEEGRKLFAPSIFLSAGESLSDLCGHRVERHVLATPRFDWENNRIGASWQPVELENGEWLLPYHGKQDDRVGYTQSFMILRENGNSFPSILNRPSERPMFATEPWELKGDFLIPCMFICSGVIMPDGVLLMGYGAADNRIGIAETRFADLLDYVKRFDAEGRTAQ